MILKGQNRIDQIMVVVRGNNNNIKYSGYDESYKQELAERNVKLLKEVKEIEEILYPEIIEYISKNVDDMADSNIECWDERYREYEFKHQIETDMFCNHDSSLEVERAEEDLERELEDHERTMLVNAFNEKVIEKVVDKFDLD